MIAKGEWAISERIPATVHVKFDQALVLRLDFDTSQRFQVDTLDHDQTHWLGSSALVPALGLRSLCRLDLLWRAPDVDVSITD